MTQIAAPFGVKGSRQCATPQLYKSNACTTAANANLAGGLRWQTIEFRIRCGQTQIRSQAFSQSVDDRALSQLIYDPKNVQFRFCLSTFCCTCIYNVTSEECIVGRLREQKWSLCCPAGGSGAFEACTEAHSHSGCLRSSWPDWTASAFHGEDVIRFMFNLMSGRCIVQPPQQLMPCRCPCS